MDNDKGYKLAMVFMLVCAIGIIIAVSVSVYSSFMSFERTMEYVEQARILDKECAKVIGDIKTLSMQMLSLMRSDTTRVRVEYIPVYIDTTRR